MANKLAVIYLLTEKQDKNEMDDPITKHIERKVIGRLKSIGQSEFYQAHAVGFKPELKFIIRGFEYKDEKQLSYNGVFYDIKRTYTDGGDVELICVREVNKSGQRQGGD